MLSFSFRIITATTCVAALGFTCLPTPLLAHGFEGDRFFPPTIQTDDPFATDELALPTLSEFNDPPSGDSPKTREFDVNAGFSKEIFPNSR